MTKGVYCLVMKLKKAQTLKIGKNLRGFFPKGHYCYVGSALNNVEKRVARHKRRSKKRHWHIDYLTAIADITGFLKIETTLKEEECKLARKILRLGGDIVVKGFGSSDCGCETHLCYFTSNPLDMLNENLRVHEGMVRPKDRQEYQRERTR